MSFGRLLFGSFFGAILAGIVGFFILLFVLSGFISSASKKAEVVVPNDVVLELNLGRVIEERVVEDPLAEIFASDLGAPTAVGLNTLLRALDAGAKDDRVKGLYIKNAYPSTSLANLEALRRAIKRFKAAGKFVVTYSEIYTEGGLFVAAAGDEIYMYPEGGADWNGLAATPMFFKGTLEKLGISVEVIRVGTFKSAAEPYTEKKMSAANREQYEVMLADMWAHLKKELAADRGVSVEALDELATEIEVYGEKSIEALLEAKLIDGVKYEDEADKLVAEKQGSEGTTPRTLSITKYAEAVGKGSYSDSRIAVIYASGEIMMGGGDDVITPARMQKAIRTARDDKRVKAIVFRVNSPGGSALASDMIWREIELARKEKTVIASYGSVSASGGYYISVNADHILAEATSITGSIGVVGLLPYTGRMFEDKLGITFDRVTTNPYADFANPNRPLQDLERRRLQSGTNDVYRDFTSKVADGREAFSSHEEVDAIGQGRVWSGVRAKEIGLVDEIGGMDRALEIAAEKAGLGDDYQVVEYPRMKTSIETLTEAFSGAKLRIASLFLTPEQQTLYRTLQLFDDPRHVYARSFSFTID